MLTLKIMPYEIDDEVYTMETYKRTETSYLCGERFTFQRFMEEKSEDLYSLLDAANPIIEDKLPVVYGKWSHKNDSRKLCEAYMVYYVDGDKRDVAYVFGPADMYLMTGGKTIDKISIL